MPALPSKTSRRKGGTPVAWAGKEERWERTLEAMGLEPMDAKSKRMIEIGKLNDDEATTPLPSTSKHKKGFLDLPVETRRHIFKLASPSELISLALVSKHFRDLAAEQIYRSFHIVFPDEDDSPIGPPPTDSLAGGLETFATSDHNYAQYLREIIIDTLGSGEKAERAYRHYLSDGSCGKFMNTLLLLTLRKARVLESFRWDIRVELNYRVFKALQSCNTLQHLHLRMQAGQSQFQILPPSPPPQHVAQTFAYMAGTHPPPPPGWNLPPPPPSLPPSSNHFALGNASATKSHQKHIKDLLPPIPRAQPTISGFKNLKTLAVLDMDTLDHVSEIQTCIKNSSSTLHTIRLSFSEFLANKSRKPPPEVHSDEESEDDEFSQLNPIPGGPMPPPLPTAGPSDPITTSKMIKAQEFRKEQEAVLARIFGQEAPKLPKAAPKKIIPSPKVKSDEDPKAKFAQELGRLVSKLMISVKPGHENSAEGKETLALIEKAARKFMESPGKTLGEASGTTGASSANTTSTPASSTADEASEETAAGDAEKDQPGLFDEPEKKKTKAIDDGVANPDDINIEEPDVQELAYEPDASASDPQTETPSQMEEAAPSGSETVPDCRSLNTAIVESDDIFQSAQADVDDVADKLMLQLHDFNLREFQEEGRRLKARLKELRATAESGQMMDSHYQDLLKAENEYARFAASLQILTRELAEAGDQILGMKMSANNSLFNIGPQSSKMKDYVRSTRGLALQSLAIYLIPVKASVLAKAVDLSVLRSITLLNVGPQAPIWNWLGRENKMSELPLSKIFTDNISLAFLAFVANLEMVDELLMLERSNKAKVESTAAKTTVTIEQIRRVILKKHAYTLKVLMIRNDHNSDWDMNAKTAMFLCQRAKKLEELAIGFGTRTMDSKHTFLQFMPGLVSLRALHTTQFRSDDTCVWVMREFRKFTVDNISHHPHMKLEWLALDSGVERLVRRKPSPPKKADIKGKGKAKAGTTGKDKGLAKMLMGASEGSMWSDNSWTGSSGLGGASATLLEGLESSDEEADYGLGPGVTKGLKVEMVEGFRFWDVPGVRIFEKEVLHGRL